MASYPPPLTSQSTYNYHNFVSNQELNKQLGDVRYAFKSQGVTPSSNLVATSLTLSGTESDHGSTTFGTKSAYDVIIQGATPNVTGGSLTEHGPILLGKRDAGAFTYSGTIPDASYSYLLDTGSELTENTKTTKRTKINGTDRLVTTATATTLDGVLVSTGASVNGAFFSGDTVVNGILNVNGLSTLQTVGCTNLTASGTGTITGALGCGTVTSTGNLNGVNLTASGTGTITGALGCGTVTSTGNLNGVNLTASGTGTITGALGCGTVTSTGNLNGVNLTASGTGTITGSLGCGTVTSTGNLNGVNLTASGTGTITGALGCGAITSSGLVTSVGVNSSDAITGTILSATNTGVSSIVSLGQINASSATGRGFVTGLTSVREEGCNFNGPIVCGSISSYGTFSCGSYGATTGVLGCGAITSTGAFSNGTHAATTGALSCGAITSTGAFSNGSNSVACGNITQSSTGTIQTGNLVGNGTTATGTISNRTAVSGSGFAEMSQLGFFASKLSGGYGASPISITTSPTTIHTFTVGAGLFLVGVFNANSGTFTTGHEIWACAVDGNANIQACWYISSTAGATVLAFTGLSTDTLNFTRTGVANDYFVSLTRIL